MYAYVRSLVRIKTTLNPQPTNGDDYDDDSSPKNPLTQSHSTTPSNAVSFGVWPGFHNSPMSLLSSHPSLFAFAK